MPFNMIRKIIVAKLSVVFLIAFPSLSGAEIAGHCELFCDGPGGYDSSSGSGSDSAAYGYQTGLAVGQTLGQAALNAYQIASERAAQRHADYAQARQQWAEESARQSEGELRKDEERRQKMEATSDEIRQGIDRINTMLGLGPVDSPERIDFDGRSEKAVPTGGSAAPPAGLGFILDSSAVKSTADCTQSSEIVGFEKGSKGSAPVALCGAKSFTVDPAKVRGNFSEPVPVEDEEIQEAPSDLKDAPAEDSLKKEMEDAWSLLSPLRPPPKKMSWKEINQELAGAYYDLKTHPPARSREEIWEGTTRENRLASESKLGELQNPDLLKDPLEIEPGDSSAMKKVKLQWQETLRRERRLDLAAAQTPEGRALSDQWREILKRERDLDLEAAKDPRVTAVAEKMADLEKRWDRQKENKELGKLSEEFLQRVKQVEAEEDLTKAYRDEFFVKENPAFDQTTLQQDPKLQAISKKWGDISQRRRKQDKELDEEFWKALSDAKLDLRFQENKTASSQ